MPQGVLLTVSAGLLGSCEASALLAAVNPLLGGLWPLNMLPVPENKGLSAVHWCKTCLFGLLVIIGRCLLTLSDDRGRCPC